jgi:hypothetical protein
LRDARDDRGCTVAGRELDIQSRLFEIAAFVRKAEEGMRSGYSAVQQDFNLQEIAFTGLGRCLCKCRNRA